MPDLTAWPYLSQPYVAHAMAAISEGLCPSCRAHLNERRECWTSLHRPVRWHACATGVGERFLDVPGRWPASCADCGTEYYP